MKKKIFLFLIIYIVLYGQAFAGDADIIWNNLKIPLAKGIIVEKSDDDNLHFIIKNVSSALLSISFGEVENRENISKRIGYKINGCGFEYIHDINFNGLDAFKWQVKCLNSGTKTTLTIPSLNCEISLNGNRSEFYKFKEIIDSIRVIDPNYE